MKLKFVANAFLWTIFVCVIGLLQIGIVFGYAKFNNSTSVSLNGFYSDGFFLFFATSLIAGILYEFQFETTCNVRNVTKNVLVCFCVLIGFTSMMTYAFAIGSKTNPTYNMSMYIQIQNYVTGAALFISFIMKGIIYNSR